MPRKQSDKIITHRIELSPKERTLFEDIIKTQKENQRLDAVTNSMQAVGTALAGTGGLIAALGLAAWFGYSIKDEVIDTTKKFVDKVSDDVLIPIFTGKSKEDIVQDILDSTGHDIEALRLRGEDLKEQSKRFCSTTSQYYDEIECQRVDAERKIWKNQYNAAIRDIKSTIDDGTVEDEVKSSLKTGIWKLFNLV
jgi:archaellum component FlaC